MRNKTSPRDAQRNAKDKTALNATKQGARPLTGKGLGKGGAKCLGRLLKRAIQNQEPAVRAKGSLPKTPIRLLKHQIKTAAESAPKTYGTRPNSPDPRQLILGLVSQYKHQGRMSMAELKQALADGGYNVAKANMRKNVLMQRLVNNETLVRTTRNSALRLDNKQTGTTTQVRTTSVKTPYLKADLRQRRIASKSFKRVEQRQPRKTHKPKGKTRKAAAKPKGKTRKAAAKPKGKTRKAAAKPKGKTYKAAAKPKGKTRKAAAKPKGKTRKAAAKPKGKTYKAAAKPKGKTRKAAAKPKGKTRKAAGSRKHRYTTTQAVWVQKARKTWRRQPKLNRRR
ncbi:histone H1-like [Clinocottus analis]|uniref:histone H1-like n=1 Tax=Clinocottus analis TaxID=304258 RepID=UPI0035C24AA6